jgi:hypothetical protein
MMEIAEDTSFRVGDGRILYRNGYFVYQPNDIEDTRIPMAIRLAHIPVPRDRYEATEVVVEKKEEEKEEVGGGF